ncbi:hypothetical protein AVEN_79423-1 [Araneus ventricosus]|uniref:Uncharacterized protein n=1 Tax=Araneus ventricosus TaxID=182803 RepID=A0A4Y2V2M5_ARAVE|nr:hypothetical protein AVEN_79423-1 [Araneus ventricosus]
MKILQKEPISYTNRPAKITRLNPVISNQPDYQTTPIQTISKSLVQVMATTYDLKSFYRHHTRYPSESGLSLELPSVQKVERPTTSHLRLL